MTKQVRVNIRTLVNTAAIRKERRNGRDKIIVPSATLPDDVIMNGIKYPAEEIEKGYASLEGTLAPLGHPTMNGIFVSASAPEGLNLGWIGAHNENVRRENGRVFMDKVIDEQRASESAGGRNVLEAIKNGEPIHTSTGVFLNLGEPDGDDHEFIARDMQFDHDAILLGEEGAATPDQGVGMMVNKAGVSQKIDVINSTYQEDEIERQIDWAVSDLARAMEKKRQLPILERIKAAVMEALGAPERETSADEGDADMADNKQLEELSAKVNTLAETVDGFGKVISDAVANAMKPLTDNMAEMKANQEAKDKAELDGHVASIVKANILDEESAKELTLNAARKLAAKAKPGKAAGLNTALAPEGEKDEFADVDLNAGLDKGAK